jgi:hypothetical protein
MTLVVYRCVWSGWIFCSRATSAGLGDPCKKVPKYPDQGLCFWYRPMKEATQDWRVPITFDQLCGWCSSILPRTSASMLLRDESMHDLTMVSEPGADIKVQHPRLDSTIPSSTVVTAQNRHHVPDSYTWAYGQVCSARLLVINQADHFAVPRQSSKLERDRIERTFQERLGTISTGRSGSLRKRGTSGKFG